MAVPSLLVDGALIAVGVAVLYAAAEGLVKGSARLARGVGVSPIVVGLTVVAFGTSAPEMVISGLASGRGAGGIALGNVVGSNIANIGLVLGSAALFMPLSVSADRARREVVGVLVAAGMIVVFAWDRILGFVEGLVLLVAIGAFLAYSYKAATAGRHVLAPEEIEDVVSEGRPRDAAFVVGGLAGVAAGAWMTVEGAVGIATDVGVPTVLVGLTVVALGTSLPELATSVVAAYRRESQLSVGNVIGSNMFNTLAVLGIAAVVRPVPVDSGTLRIGLPVMVGFSLALVPFVVEDFELDRWKGALLLAGFVAFWAYLIWVGAGWVG